MSGSRRVTLGDVAEAAGVSPASVGNVLRSHPHVRPAVRQRVLAAVAELGYRPLAIGQNLRSGRTGAVNLAIPNFAQPYFAEMASLAVAAAERSDLRLVVQQTDNRLDRERDIADAWNLGAADGLIFSPSVISDEEIEERRGQMPLVLLGEHSRLSTVNRVYLDSVAMARLATEHLIERGARRIVMFGDRQSGDSNVIGERVQGYREALAAHGLKWTAPLIKVDDWNRPDGEHAADELLRSGEAFDGIFCANDLLALGALRRLRGAGLHAPANFRIAAVDDIEEASFSEPTLTTVAVDRKWMIDTAFRLLTREIGQPAGVPEQVQAPHHLVMRESTS